MITKIKIVCVGKIKEKYILEGINEFLKRLDPFCKIKLIELKDEGLNEEAKKLKEQFSEKTLILDEKGAEFSSAEFAHLIKTLDYDLTLVIGGHNGISEELKKENKEKLFSLSKMTFTHEMARLFLIEQIYRAYMINGNRKYHK